MSIGGKKDDYDFCKEEDDLEWWAEQRMNIREVRMIYSSLSHYQSIWEKYNEHPLYSYSYIILYIKMRSLDDKSRLYILSDPTIKPIPFSPPPPSAA